MTDFLPERSKPYGIWESPLSPKTMSQGMRLNDVRWDSDGQTLVWLEGRSDRGVLVASRNGEAPNDLTTDLSVRATVGYGGGDYAVANGHVVFSSDGRLYRQAIAGSSPKPITPKFGAFASPAVSQDGNWIAFVHSYERKDALGIVDADGQLWPAKLVSGDDFYMQPAWHPSGMKLAFVAWNHPEMPWDGTEVRVVVLEQNEKGLPQPRETHVIAGGRDISCFQPEFSPDGRYLAYVSDVTGWWQLYVLEMDSEETRQLSHDEAEHGLPGWVQGMRTIAWNASSDALHVLRSERGFVHLWRYGLDGEGGRINAGEYSAFAEISATSAHGQIAVVGSAPDIPPRIISITPNSDGEPVVIRRAYSESVPRELFSTAQAVSWTAGDGGPVHGLYYPPTGGLQNGREELPPAIVMIHGGPTANRVAQFMPDVQFFTSRGYAVLQVNYRGSTGYGREYMLKLRGMWGQLDREDAISGGQFLIDSGLADPKRLVVEGGSAGGTTVLMSLIHNPGFFRAGVCLFGVSNMFMLADDTHKFEERYLDTMLGPLPNAREIYRKRSAIFLADKIVDPIIIFQGEIDQVVPRDQSDTIVDSLRKRNVPHEYHVYEGEGHGWRKVETIEAYYTAAERFLRQQVIFA